MMKVWIDQDLCTGDGLCVELCPSVFDMHDDGLAYVKEADWKSLYGPDAPRTDKSEPVLQMTATATVPDDQAEACIDAAEECPGECIFIEVD
jgi:ferredoxin